MALPEIPLERRLVLLPGGVEVEVRGLTRGEFLSRPELADGELDGAGVEAVEVFMLAAGTDTPLEDARSWYQHAPAAVVGPLVEAIYACSGVTVEAGKGAGAA